MMATRVWGMWIVLALGLWGCGDDPEDADTPMNDATVPDALVVDAAAADAMIDPVATCSAAIECAIDTPRRRDDCALEYGEAIDARYQALLACAQGAPGGSCDTQTSVHVGCLAENCAEEAEACVGPLPSSQGDAPCAEVYACFVACEGNVPCAFDCYAQGSTMALRVFDRLQDCNALAVCDLSDIDCISRPCRGLVSACGIPR